MIKNENTVIIKRPVGEVFEFMANGENTPLWQTSTQEVRKDTQDPIGVGTKFTNVTHFLGRKFESTLEYTAYEPNKKISSKSVSGPIPVKIETTFEPIAEGETKVTVVGELEVGGFFKLAEPLVARMIQRQVEASNANLKDLLEAQAGGAA